MGHLRFSSGLLSSELLPFDHRVKLRGTQPCARRLAVLRRSSSSCNIRLWLTASRPTSWGPITWTASTGRHWQQVKNLFSWSIPSGHHPRRHHACSRGKISLLSYEGKGKSNSLCLLLMFRGLNNVLQDAIQQQQILLPPFLMTLWFNPSLFTIPRKMFQSPLDLWSDTSNLCSALACLGFCFFIALKHIPYSEPLDFMISVSYTVCHVNLTWIISFGFRIRLLDFNAPVWNDHQKAKKRLLASVRCLTDVYT